MKAQVSFEFGLFKLAQGQSLPIIAPLQLFSGH